MTEFSNGPTSVQEVILGNYITTIYNYIYFAYIYSKAIEIW